MTSLSPSGSSRNSELQNLSLSDQNLLLVQQLDIAKTSKSNLNAQLEFLKKKYQGIQDELQFVLHSQSKLEKQYYALELELENSKQREDDALRKARELEFKLTTESKDSELEKSKLLAREEQLSAKLKSLQSQIQQKVSPPVTPSPRVSRTRSVSVNFSPPSYIATIPDEFDHDNNSEASLLHEVRLANRTVRQQIKEISQFKVSIKQLKEQIAIMTTQDVARSTQIEQLNQQIAQLLITNSSHLEEIESYQLLLENRTLRGQFSLRHRNSFNSLSEQSSPSTGFNLSSELGHVQAVPTEDNPIHSIDQTSPDENCIKKTKDEFQMLKDENKALALYISKILGKIMSNPVLAEAITANGDSRREVEVSDNFNKVKNPSKIMVSPNSNPSQPELKVAFTFPSISPDSQSSSEQTKKESINDFNFNGNSQGSFRSRRSKSMSVAKHPALDDSNNGEDHQDAFMAGVLSFRNAIKKVTGPWKSSTVSKKPTGIPSPLMDNDSSVTIISDSPASLGI